MKNEDKNWEYFDEIQYKLKWLVDPSKTNELNKDRLKKVKAKLSPLFLGILKQIEEYLFVILVGNLTYRLAKIDEPYSEKEYKLYELLKEAEKLLENYIISVDKKVFFEFIVGLVYWLAKIEAEDVININKKFLTAWTQDHNYVEKKYKTKRKGVLAKEKIKIIMGDRIENLDKIKEERQKLEQRFIDGKERLFVNIDEEVNLETVEPSQNFDFPVRWRYEKEGYRIIKEYDKCIKVGEKVYRLKDYYLEVAFSQIDSEWIKSKDFIKQIITVYMIKRCQNGDDKAFSKLFNIYSKKAQKVEDDFIKSRGKNVDMTMVENRSQTILMSLLKGDNLETVYENLAKSPEEKKDVDLLNKKPFEALNQSYTELHKVFFNQLVFLIEKFKTFESETKNPRNRLKKAIKDKTKNDYLQTIFDWSLDLMHRVDASYTTFSLLEPNEFIKISPKFNKSLFRPNKNGNLTSWLFGGKEKTKFRGMMWQSLSDLFDRGINKNATIEYNDDYNYDNQNHAPKPKKEESENW